MLEYIFFGIAFIAFIYLSFDRLTSKASKSKLYTTNNSKKVQVTTAHGMTGILLTGSNPPILRFYHKKNKSVFVDCPIHHYDVTIKIQDPGATLYIDEDQNVWMDYSPKTLGYKLSEKE